MMDLITERTTQSAIDVGLDNFADVKSEVCKKHDVDSKARADFILKIQCVYRALADSTLCLRSDAAADFFSVLLYPPSVVTPIDEFIAFKVVVPTICTTQPLRSFIAPASVRNLIVIPPKGG